MEFGILNAKVLVMFVNILEEDLPLSDFNSVLFSSQQVSSANKYIGSLLEDVLRRYRTHSSYV